MPRELHTQARRDRDRLDLASLTPEEGVRLRQRVDTALEMTSRRPFLLRASLAASAAAGALVALLLLKAPPTPGWYEAQTGEHCLRGDGDSVSVLDDCRDPVVLAMAPATATLDNGTNLTWLAGDVRLQRGRALFAVEPQGNSDPFRVRVSHGAIVALGTSFQVVQREMRGNVEVHAGRVLFEWTDGAPSNELGPGQRLSWPRQETPTAVPPSATPQHPSKLSPKPPPKARPEPPQLQSPEPAASPSLVEIMQRLSQLRSQRRFREASELLRAAKDRDDFSPEQQERFSYELGLILADQLQDAGACALWREHLRRFPSGSRAGKVHTRVQRCP